MISTYDGCAEAWLCRVAWFTNQGLVIKEARYLGDYPGAALSKRLMFVSQTVILLYRVIFSSGLFP